MAEASYPSDLKYHEEHDWARIDGDTAIFGVTWYAQDQLGELVFFDPPEVGSQVQQGAPYAEVETALTDSTSPYATSFAIVAPSSGGSKWTSSPRASAANHVMPSTASSPSTRAQSCSSWYFRSDG